MSHTDDMTTIEETQNRTGAVDRLLHAVETGTGASITDAFAHDAVLDATVPEWRFHLRGAAAIARQFETWFAGACRFEELERSPIPDGEVVVYLVAWEENGVPHAAHHCHVLTVDPAADRIVRDRFFCGGRWNATRLAAMAEADNVD